MHRPSLRRVDQGKAASQGRDAKDALVEAEVGAESLRLQRAGDVPSSRNAVGWRLINKLGASEVTLAPDEAALPHAPGAFFNDQKLDRDQSHLGVESQAYSSLRCVTHRIRKELFKSWDSEQAAPKANGAFHGPSVNCAFEAGFQQLLMSLKAGHVRINTTSPRRIEATVFEVNSNGVATLMQLLKLDTEDRLGRLIPTALRLLGQPRLVSSNEHMVLIYRPNVNAAVTFSIRK